MVIFTAIWCNSGSTCAGLWGLGACCAFLVFFFVEVSDKGKPSSSAQPLAGGRAGKRGVKPRTCRSHPCHFPKISTIDWLPAARGEIGTID